MEPEIICTEHCDELLSGNGDGVHHQIKFLKGILIAQLEEKFSPEITIRPSPPKITDIETLCSLSKATLSDAMEEAFFAWN